SISLDGPDESLPPVSHGERPGIWAPKGHRPPSARAPRAARPATQAAGQGAPDARNGRRTTDSLAPVARRAGLPGIGHAPGQVTPERASFLMQDRLPREKMIALYRRRSWLEGRGCARSSKNWRPAE